MAEVSGNYSVGREYFKAADGTIYKVVNGKARKIEDQTEAQSLFDADNKAKSEGGEAVVDKINVSQLPARPANAVTPKKGQAGGYYVHDNTAPAENCGYRFYDKNNREITRDAFMKAEQQYMDTDGNIKAYDWKAKLKSRATGIGNFFANMFTQKEPVLDEYGEPVLEKNGKPKMKRKFSLGQTLKSIGMCAAIAVVCIATAGTAVPAIIAGGFALMAGAGIVKGEIKNSDENRSPEEKMETGEEIGENTAAFGLAVSGIRGGIKSWKSFNAKVAVKNNALRASKGDIGFRDVVRNRALTFKEVVGENVGGMWDGVKSAPSNVRNKAREIVRGKEPVEGTLEHTRVTKGTNDFISEVRNKTVNDLAELKAELKKKGLTSDERAVLKEKIAELEPQAKALGEIREFSDQIATTKPKNLDALKEKIQKSGLDESAKSNLLDAIEVKRAALKAKTKADFQDLINKNKGNEAALKSIENELVNRKVMNPGDKAALLRELYEGNPEVFPEVNAQIGKNLLNAEKAKIGEIKTFEEFEKYVSENPKSQTDPVLKEAMQTKFNELLLKDIKGAKDLNGLKELEARYGDAIRNDEAFQARQAEIIEKTINKAKTPDDLRVLDEYKTEINNNPELKAEFEAKQAELGVKEKGGTKRKAKKKAQEVRENTELGQMGGKCGPNNDLPETSVYKNKTIRRTYDPEKKSLKEYEYDKDGTLKKVTYKIYNDEGKVVSTDVYGNRTRVLNDVKFKDTNGYEINLKDDIPKEYQKLDKSTKAEVKKIRKNKGTERIQEVPKEETPVENQPKVEENAEPEPKPDAGAPRSTEMPTFEKVSNFKNTINKDGTYTKFISETKYVQSEAIKTVTEVSYDIKSGEVKSVKVHRFNKDGTFNATDEYILKDGKLVNEYNNQYPDSDLIKIKNGLADEARQAKAAWEEANKPKPAAEEVDVVADEVGTGKTVTGKKSQGFKTRRQKHNNYQRKTSTEERVDKPVKPKPEAPKPEAPKGPVRPAGNGNQLPKGAIFGTSLAGANIIDQLMRDGDVVDDDEMWVDPNANVIPGGTVIDNNENIIIDDTVINPNGQKKGGVKSPEPEVITKTETVIKEKTVYVEKEEEEDQTISAAEVFSITDKCQKAMSMGTENAITEALNDLSAVGPFRGKRNLRRMLKNKLKQMKYVETHDGDANEKFNNRMNRRSNKAETNKDKVDPRYLRKAEKRGYTPKGFDTET